MKVTGPDLRPYINTRTEDWLRDFSMTAFRGAKWYCIIDLWLTHDDEPMSRRKKMTWRIPAEFETDTLLEAFRNAHRALLNEAHERMDESYDLFHQGEAYPAYHAWVQAAAAQRLSQMLERQWVTRELFASLIHGRNISSVQLFGTRFPAQKPINKDIMELRFPNMVRDARVEEMPPHQYAGWMREFLPHLLEFPRIADNEFNFVQYRVLFRPEGDFPPVPAWVSHEMLGAWSEAHAPGTVKKRW